MKIVHRIEVRAEDFIDALKMVQIGAGKMPAGITAARLVEWPDVVAIARVAQPDRAIGGENPAVARIARLHHAIEHVDAVFYGIDNIGRLSDAHQIAWYARTQ